LTACITAGDAPLPVPLKIRRVCYGRAGSANHSFNFDHRRRPDTLRTAMAMAFF